MLFKINNLLYLQLIIILACVGVKYLTTQFGALNIFY